jgi:uncharacterized protein involved in response to NO
MAGIWSAVAVPLWLLVMMSGNEERASILTRDWHVHEMLFGYTGAVIAGYMIVAGANWTGRYPVAGAPVIVLAGVWAAGRLAMASGALSLVDLAFLFLFAAALWREQVEARNGRNLVPCVVISLLAVANLGFHMRDLLPEMGNASERLAIGLICSLIAVMGGRLVPSFTRNWLASRRVNQEPAPYGPFDIAVVVLTVLGLASWLVLPDAPTTGVALVVCGVATFVRLRRWRGWTARGEALIWGLHLGHGWLAIGLMLLGLSILAPGIPYAAAIHALTSGAIGVTSLAMMTRTSLSLTGRERRADGWTSLMYVLVNAAAILRVAASFIAELRQELLGPSAICWSLAFGLFIASYGPMLCKPFHRGVRPERSARGLQHGRG